MNAPLTLTAGRLRCEIVPDLGACISGFWFDNTPVLRSPGAANLGGARESGSYPLVPFSNRIAQASLSWQGTSHPLVKNFGDEPHSIHGVGWQRPWSVLDSSGSFALLSYEHKPDKSWPFAFDTSQAFRLTGQALELSLSVTNQSGAATPVGLGWHPYFTKRPGSRIRFEAQGLWEMDSLKLPTRRTPSRGMDVDCAVLDVDHCFDGWRGTVHLSDEKLACSIQSKLTHLVVYTHSTVDCIAIEPVSHVNNALDLMERGIASADALGVRVLQPGESLTCEMSIRVQAI